eukprot:1159532-Pelagomonas_calceolata.AAC.2
MSAVTGQLEGWAPVWTSRVPSQEDVRRNKKKILGDTAKNQQTSKAGGCWATRPSKTCTCTNFEALSESCNKYSAVA